MIAHPDTATMAALGAYHERIEQAHINHMINRAVPGTDRSPRSTQPATTPPPREQPG